jgi:hypothetical protein
MSAFLARLQQWSTRPVTEWLFLVLMALHGASSIRDAITSDGIGIGARAVLAGQWGIGFAALGIVLAILLRKPWGVTMLWLYAVAVVCTAPVASIVHGGAPTVAALGAALLAAFVCAPIIWYGTRRVHANVTVARWDALVADHARAADEFVDAIGALTPEQWLARPTPDAWSAADITEHLARTYAQFAGEARGKNPLVVRVRGLRQVLLRLTVKPRLLRGAPFPRARAPRSLRPGGGLATPADGVAMFRATGDSCLRDLEIMRDRRPYRTFMHPYLGALPIHELLLFAAQHIRHHRRQLPR